MVNPTGSMHTTKPRIMYIEKKAGCGNRPWSYWASDLQSHWQDSLFIATKVFRRIVGVDSSPITSMRRPGKITGFPVVNAVAMIGMYSSSAPVRDRRGRS